MEEGIAAPIGGRETTTEFIPPVDSMHGFVGDDQVEDRGRAVSIYCSEFEEARIEPRGEDMGKVGVQFADRRKILKFEKVRTHSNQLARPVRSKIQ